MNDFAESRRAAIRYWERRRIVYNVALLPPSLLAYFLNSAVAEGVGDTPNFGLPMAGLLFLASAIGANLCYSFAYALEFLFLNARPGSWWKGWGRTVAFFGGTVVGMLLATFGGQQIYLLQYSPHMHLPNMA